MGASLVHGAVTADALEFEPCLPERLASAYLADLVTDPDEARRILAEPPVSH